MKRFPNERAVTIESRDDGTQTITGYAAVFHRAEDAGTEYALMSDYVERIQPGAFDRALDEAQDVRALFNHDASMILGRASAGTLRMSVDATGLRYEVDVPDTTLGRDLATSIQRGDVTGSSFSFSVPDKGAEIERSKDSGLTVRNLVNLNLHDVGPVSFPAYAATSTALRSEENVEEAQAALSVFEAKEAEAIAVRARKFELEQT